MAEFPSPFHVRRPVLVKIIAACLEAIAEALALNVVELLRGRIPAATIMRRGRAVLSREKNGRRQGKNKRRKCESSVFHGCIPPCSAVEGFPSSIGSMKKAALKAMQNQTS